MKRLSVLVLLSVIAWYGPSQAQEALVFDFPRDFSPQPSSFLVTYRNSNDPGGVLQQLGIPWHPLAACARVAPRGTPEPELFCATLPDCLAPGLYTFWIQAVWPDAQSEQSELLTCQATGGCQCTKVATTNPPNAPAPAPAPGGATTPPPTRPSPPVGTPPPVQIPQPVFHLPQVAPA